VGSRSKYGAVLPAAASGHDRFSGQTAHQPALPAHENGTQFLEEPIGTYPTLSLSRC
jgi:hypothetical protein